jgi:hypothetical protein
MTVFKSSHHAGKNCYFLQTILEMYPAIVMKTRERHFFLEQQKNMSDPTIK